MAMIWHRKNAFLQVICEKNAKKFRIEFLDLLLRKKKKRDYQKSKPFNHSGSTDKRQSAGNDVSGDNCMFFRIYFTGWYSSECDRFRKWSSKSIRYGRL